MDALRLVHERTLAERSARVELSVERHWPVPPTRRRRRGGLARPLIGAGKSAAKRIWKVATRDFNWAVSRGEGLIDLRGRRYLLDFGSYAQLYADGQKWSGRSGRPLATLPAHRGDSPPTPLWLLDLLAGATEVKDDGIEVVRGTKCRRVTGTVDLGRASRATPGGLAFPLVGRFEDLLALPVVLWTGDDRIRRLRFRTEQQTDTVDLWDFGVPLDEFDWSTLPSFRTPP